VTNDGSPSTTCQTRRTPTGPRSACFDGGMSSSGCVRRTPSCVGPTRFWRRRAPFSRPVSIVPGRGDHRGAAV